MADPTAGTSPPVPRCPWCSAELPRTRARSKTCPSCHANLAGDRDAQLPGLTAIDLEKLAFRRSTSPKRSRLMSWISGDLDYEDATEPVAPPGSLAPPPLEVRREMLRLEMDALIADLKGEADALAADEAVAQGATPAAREGDAGPPPEDVASAVAQADPETRAADPGTTGDRSAS
jgi:hypothetical protein